VEGGSRVVVGHGGTGEREGVRERGLLEEMMDG